MRHRAFAALILGVLSVLSLLGIGSNYHRGIFLVIFGVVVGITACWFGVTALRKASQAGTMRPRWALFGTVLGALGALFGVLVLIFFAAFWQQLNRYSECMNTANTPSAQQTCMNQLRQSVKIGEIGTGG
ncbi:MAG TPA: hypothetical protein VMC03_05160 [Streptosporangiaceae bacterium]|nr:hypothetical protein [Streptosporangiaceae bacterium]